MGSLRVYFGWDHQAYLAIELSWLLASFINRYARQGICPFRCVSFCFKSWFWWVTSWFVLPVIKLGIQIHLTTSRSLLLHFTIIRAFVYFLAGSDSWPSRVLSCHIESTCHYIIITKSTSFASFAFLSDRIPATKLNCIFNVLGIVVGLLFISERTRMNMPYTMR